MTDFEPPMVYMLNNVTEKATYFPYNETFDVTDFVTGGISIDILHNLENAYNFSTKLYMRKDGKWGVPYILPNGTIVIPKGIVKDLVEGPADMLVSALAILPMRLLVIDYLPSVAEDFASIMIPIEDDEEGLDLTVYYVPFSRELWFTIIIAAFIMTVYFYITEWLKNKSVSRITKFPIYSYFVLIIIK